jgi:thymidine kinase
MAKFWFVVKHAQAICSRCGDPSPVVSFRDQGTSDEKKLAISERLISENWDVVGGKAYCAVCRRIGG